MFRNVVSGLVRQRTTFTGVQRRNFAAHGAPKKEWTGIGKFMVAFCISAVMIFANCWMKMHW